MRDSNVFSKAQIYAESGPQRPIVWGILSAGRVSFRHKVRSLRGAESNSLTLTWENLDLHLPALSATLGFLSASFGISRHRLCSCLGALSLSTR